MAPLIKMERVSGHRSKRRCRHLTASFFLFLEFPPLCSDTHRAIYFHFDLAKCYSPPSLSLLLYEAPPLVCVIKGAI